MSEENKSIALPSNAKENTLRIAEIKKKHDLKKFAEAEKKVAELKKKWEEEGITDKREDCIPLNEEEKKMVAQWRERAKNAQKSPIVFTYTLDDDGNEIGSIETVDGYPISPTDKWELWSTALSLATGSTNQDFGFLIFNLCSSASGTSKPDNNKGSKLTATLNALQALKPQDEFEGMLISRLISLHFQSMKYLSCTNNDGQTTQGVDININRSTKLFRLYNETLETLMRYRRRGEQRVVVQHVNVGDGGKAVVNGSMIAGGGGGE